MINTINHKIVCNDFFINTLHLSAIIGHPLSVVDAPQKLQLHSTDTTRLQSPTLTHTGLCWLWVILYMREWPQYFMRRLHGALKRAWRPKASLYKIRETVFVMFADGAEALFARVYNVCGWRWGAIWRVHNVCGDDAEAPMLLTSKRVLICYNSAGAKYTL